MRLVAIQNLTHPLPGPIQAEVCDQFFSRLRGLMFRAGLKERSGLLLVEARESVLNAAIHMLFMRFPIAVIWMSGDYRVVDVRVAQPWRLSYAPVKPARYTLETRAEYAAEFVPGDQLVLHDA